MAYTYDFFFSYRHQEGMREGVLDTLLPCLKAALSLHLGRECAVFLDVDQLDQHEPGQEQLIAALGQALARSRCMVAVWQPSYFQSIWCWNECRAFLKRGDAIARPLIYPVTIHNGDLFPPFARAARPLHLSQYSINLPTFKQSSQYMRFLEEVRTGASDLAETIRLAPAWRADWATEQWFTDEPPPISSSMPRF